MKNKCSLVYRNFQVLFFCITRIHVVIYLFFNVRKNILTVLILVSNWLLSSPLHATIVHCTIPIYAVVVKRVTASTIIIRLSQFDYVLFSVTSSHLLANFAQRVIAQLVKNDATHCIQKGHELRLFFLD